MKFLQTIAAQMKEAVLYLNTHPLVHYMIITTILVIASLLLISSLRKKNETPITDPAPTIKSPVIKPIASNKDINAIAGNDVISTQLDLAKAYIEMNQKKLAQNILQKALKQGSSSQQHEARQLLETL